MNTLTQPWPRRLLLFMVISVPAHVAAMWWLRKRDLRDGLPCEARGTWGCTYDEGLAAGYSFAVGFAFAIGVLAWWALSTRFPATSTLLAAATVAAWLVLAVILLFGTQG